MDLIHGVETDKVNTSKTRTDMKVYFSKGLSGVIVLSCSICSLTMYATFLVVEDKAGGDSVHLIGRLAGTAYNRVYDGRFGKCTSNLNEPLGFSGN